MITKYIKEEQKKYQKVVTDKLRGMINMKEIDVLSDYAWQMALSQKGSHEYMCTELKDFFGEDTNDFVTWLLDYVKDVNKQIKQEEQKKKEMGRSSTTGSRDHSLGSKNNKDHRTLHKISKQSPKIPIRGTEKISRRGNFSIRKRSRSNDRRYRSISRSLSPFSRRGGRRRVIIDRRDRSNSRSSSVESYRRRGHYTDKEERGGKWDNKNSGQKHATHDHKANTVGKHNANSSNRIVFLENADRKTHRHMNENSDLNERKKKAILKPNPRFLGDSAASTSTPFIQPLPPRPSQSGEPQVATFGFVVPGYDKGMMQPINYIPNSYMVPQYVSVDTNCLMPDQKNKPIVYAVPPSKQQSVNSAYTPLEHMTQNTQSANIMKGNHIYQNKSANIQSSPYTTPHVSADTTTHHPSNGQVNTGNVATAAPLEGGGSNVTAAYPVVGSQENIAPVTPQVIVKIHKRCMNYPNCQYGDSCRYIHPSENCRKWPYCAFGPECIYIHPEVPCKFGAYCCNYYCNYSHNTVNDPASPVIGSNGFFLNKKLINSGNNRCEEKKVDDQVKNMSTSLPKTPPEMMKEKSKDMEYTENEYISNMLESEKQMEIMNQMRQQEQQHMPNSMMQQQQEQYMQNNMTQQQEHQHMQKSMAQQQEHQHMQQSMMQQEQQHARNIMMEQQQEQQKLEQMVNEQPYNLFSFNGVTNIATSEFQMNNVETRNDMLPNNTDGVGNRTNFSNVEKMTNSVDINSMQHMNLLGNVGNINSANSLSNNDSQNMGNEGVFKTNINPANNDTEGF